jgi:uncharacterized repeat protein (TIGR03803 family)
MYLAENRFAGFSALTLALLAALVLIVALPARAQKETVLYNFCSQPRCVDGFNPNSSLIFDGKGNLYGTTYNGGFGYGYGTVFKLSPNDNAGWNETAIYSFCSAPSCDDGSEPFFSNVVFDNAGNLYGTTALGGAYDYGVVFELTPVGTTWAETVLYSFSNGNFADDGGSPLNGLVIDPAGNLYGTTCAGDGTVFELSPSPSGWVQQILHAPVSRTGHCVGLARDDSGNLFYIGPSEVFELSPKLHGGFDHRKIHIFTGAPQDGSSPMGTLAFDQAGNVYGITSTGGTSNCGTIYKLNPEKNGKWTENILYSFRCTARNSFGQVAGLVLDAAGNIYGASSEGGSGGWGSAFELVAPVGNGRYREKFLSNFGKDGWEPSASLILDNAGNLYGTTVMGGSSDAGIVFKVTP